MQPVCQILLHLWVGVIHIRSFRVVIPCFLSSPTFPPLIIRTDERLVPGHSTPELVPHAILLGAGTAVINNYVRNHLNVVLVVLLYTLPQILFRAIVGV